MISGVNCTVQYICGDITKRLSVKIGSHITPFVPEVSVEYVYGGCYRDGGFTDRFDFMEPVRGDLTLFVKMTPKLQPAELTNNIDILPNRVPHGVRKSGRKKIFVFLSVFVIIIAVLLLVYFKNDKFTVILSSTPFDDVTKTETPLLTTVVPDSTEVVVVMLSGEGSVINEVNCKTGTLLQEPEIPVTEGFVFAGWFYNEEYTIPVEFPIHIKEDVKLYANMEEIFYTVSFVTYEGTEIEPVTVRYGHTVECPDAPVWPEDSRAFLEWRWGENAFSFDTPIFEDTVLIAAWSAADSYAYVTFVSNDSVQNVSLELGSAISMPSPDPEIDGYTFFGWFADSAFQIPYDFSQPVNTDITLYAKLAVSSHTITFNTNGGNNIKAVSVGHGEVLSSLPVPKREGYTFVGWYTDTALKNAFNIKLPVSRNITMYAKWKVNLYTVVFVTNGGSSIGDILVEHNKALPTVANPERAGYTFTGWYKDPAFTVGFSLKTPVSKNTTLYAKWTASSYTVTFKSNGGSELTPLSTEYGKTLSTLPKAEREGYIFAGWFTDAALTNMYSLKTPVKENVTLYAKWEIIQYTITFITNGGSEVSGLVEDHGKSLAALPKPEKTGYTFAGWYTDEALTDAFDVNTPIRQNLILYSKWKEIEYKEKYVYYHYSKTVNGVTGIRPDNPDGTYSRHEELSDSPFNLEGEEMVNNRKYEVRTSVPCDDCGENKWYPDKKRLVPVDYGT